MIFLLLFNGFFVSMLQGVDENNHRGEGVVWRNLADVPWIKKMKSEGRLEDLPASADLSSEMPPVGNQGTQCSCVGWAVGYYHKTHQEWVEHKLDPNWDIKLPKYQFSPAFIYNLINGGINDVALGVDAFRVLRQHGCATLDKCPYDPSNYTTWPTEDAFESAIPYRAEKVEALETKTDDGHNALKALLAWGYGDGAGGRTAVISVIVHSKFHDISSYGNVFCAADKDATTPDEEHALCVVGYDNNFKHRDPNDGAFKVVNSWDTTWGDGGYGWISYDALKDSDIHVKNGGFTKDRVGYSPTLLTRFKITHPRREGIQLRFYIDDPVVPSWDTVFFNWERLQDPECYITPNPYPENKIVFDLSDADPDPQGDEDDFGWTDVIFMEIEDVIADVEGGDGELESLEGDYRGAPPGTYTAFDPPETRHIPDGGSVLVPLSRSSFWRSYGGPGLDHSNSVIQTPGGGYTFGGATNSGTYGHGGVDVLLIKTDNAGTEEWSQTYGGTESDGGYCVKQTDDKGYVIAGSTRSFGDAMGDVYLVKADSMGVMEWDESYGDVGVRDWAFSVDQCTDGGYIICGGRNYCPPDHVLSDGWLIKTDSLGNMEWDRTIAADTADYQFSSVQQTDDEGYIVVASVASEDVFGSYFDYDMLMPGHGNTIWKSGDVPLSSTNWIYLLKTDSLGVTEWDTAYTDTGVAAYSVQQTSDGGYIIGGQAFGDAPGYAYLLKVNSTGGVEWHKLFGVPFANAYSALETSDHGFALAGYTDLMDYNSGDAYLVKTDQFGNLEFELTSDIPVTDLARGCQETSDYGFILAGYAFSGSSEYADIILVKTPAGEGPSGIPIQELPPEVISADTSIISIYSSTPNPFFNEVNISYSLRKKCDVEISVHNIIGQKVKDFGRGEKSSGMHTNSWNGLDNHGKELPSGIYFFRIEAGSEQAIRKLVLVR